MGGSGGSSSRPYGSSTSSGAEKRPKVDKRVVDSEFAQAVNEYLKQKLVELNDRDLENLNRHIETIREKLSAEIDEFLELRFGGSVSRHTYVDGISDVDILVDVKGTDIEGYSPADLLDHFAHKLRERLPDTEIRVGEMAVTLCYSDGMEIQLLPCLRTNGELRLPEAGGSEWSDVVRPLAFASQLTLVNADCGGRVVPVIKLFKAIQQSLPENARLSGYHVESLAVNAFKGYEGSTSYQKMLGYFCRYASEHVTQLISDSTGQSLFVDSYLGPEDSLERQRVSAFLGRMSTRLASADEKCDLIVWQRHFGDE